MNEMNSAAQLEDAIEKRSKPLPPAVAASWRRSFVNGVDSQSTKLRPITEADIEAAQNSIKGGIDYARGFYIDYLQSLWDLFSSWGGLVLFTDHSLRVCSIRGSEELLAELADRNVAFGTDLSEHNAGTNAASITRDTMQGCRLAPSENYSKVFQDYACFAQGPIRIGTDDFILVMAAIPIANFTEERAMAAEFALQSLVLMGKRGETPDATVSSQLLNELISREGASYVIVNENGQIVDIGSNFLSLMHVQSGKTVGMHLRERLPNLAPILDACAELQEGSAPLDVRGLQIAGEPAWARAFFLSAEDKPFIAIVVHAESLRNRDDDFNEARDSLANIVGASDVMQSLRANIKNMAEHERDVLLVGEIGTGKGATARAIHNLSDRKSGPFVPCNCALLSGENTEARLLGFDEAHPGLLERANGGTLFLDGIETLSSQAQSILSGFIDMGEINRLNDLGALKRDVRLIMASTYNAEELLAHGFIRPDFYYRLPTAVLETPALRDHAEDIPLIAASLSRRMHDRGRLSNEQPLADIDSSVLGKLPWKGNIRELKRLVEQIYFEGNAAELIERTVETQLQNALASDTVASENKQDASINQAPSYEEYERDQIVKALRKHRGNKTAAAKELGMSRQKLYARIKAYNVR